MDWLTYFGISPPDMLAGFLGGIVNVFVFPKPGPRAILAAVMFGVVIGNFAGAPVNALTQWANPHAGACLIGFLGPAFILWLIQRQIGYATKKEDSA
jgi:hypothetical protein